MVPKGSPDFVGMVPLIEHQYSDRLMEVLLKGRNPEVDLLEIESLLAAYPIEVRSVRFGVASLDALRESARRVG